MKETRKGSCPRVWPVGSFQTPYLQTQGAHEQQTGVCCCTVITVRHRTEVSFLLGSVNCTPYCKIFRKKITALNAHEGKLKIKIILSYSKYSAFGFRPLSKPLIIKKKPYKIHKVKKLFIFCRKELVLNVINHRSCSTFSPLHWNEIFLVGPEANHVPILFTAINNSELFSVSNNRPTSFFRGRSCVLWIKTPCILVPM